MTNLSKIAQPDTLTPPLTAAFDLGDPSACATWLRERYMKTARDQHFEDALTEILQCGPGGVLTATPQRIGLINETRGLLVIGATGDGKTAMIRRNLRYHSGIGLTEGLGPGKALYVRVPAEATLKGVATDILKQTGYPKVNARLRTTEVWDMAIARLAMLEITILWIDEAHHMLEIQKEVTSVLRRLKTLMQGDHSLALIVSGIHKLDEKVQTDKETSDRFVRIRLGPVRSDHDRQALMTFMDACCEQVQLARMTDQHLVERMECATNGSFGRSIELFHAAVGRAMRRGDGLLTLHDFRRSFDLKRGCSDDGPFDAEPWPELKAILEKKGLVA